MLDHRTGGIPTDGLRDGQQAALPSDDSGNDHGRALREIEHLRTALQSRGIIGVAMGILAERHQWTPEAAFQWLVKLSQHPNTKVVDLARRVVDEAAAAAISAPD